MCEGTVLSYTEGACSRGYTGGERGREAPKSLLEERLIEASANIGAQERVCSVSCAECWRSAQIEKTEPASPFIDTRRGGVHVREKGEVVVLPRIGGVQWSTTVESILRVLEIMAPGVAVVLGVVLGLAEIVPVSWQLQWAAWWSL